MFGIPGWAIGVGFIILASALAKALFGGFSSGAADNGLRRLRRASRHDLARALEDMEQRLGALEDRQRKLGGVEDLQTRLSEVEERLDFAERLLAKQRDGDRAIPPKA